MQALEGRVREHHQFLLARLLREWEWYEEEIASLDQQIEQQIRRFASAVTLWQTMPGASLVTAFRWHRCPTSETPSNPGRASAPRGLTSLVDTVSVETLFPPVSRGTDRWL